MTLSRRARADKTVVSPLEVYAWCEGAGFLHAGTLEMDEHGGTDALTLTARFTYASAYLRAPEAYALDPRNLPLAAQPFDTDHAFKTLGAIYDAAPDAWGRRVIAAQEPGSELAENAHGEGIFRRAFLRGADGIGALVLCPRAGMRADELQSLVDQSQAERPTLTDLDKAAAAARKLELTGGVGLHEQYLLAGSWTIGGARPKAILRNDGLFGGAVPSPLPGASVIAKFPAAHEDVDRAGIESACLAMSRDVGFAVPEHRVVPVSTGRAFLLSRFDRYAIEGAPGRVAPEGRRHYLSANSLVSRLMASKRLDAAQDRIVFSCGNLISIAGEIGARPSEARVAMFARLLWNTALHNTDDHLKNLGFLRTQAGARGREAYELAPVFDVSPQVPPQHFVHLTDVGRRYDVPAMLGEARKLGIAPAAANAAWERMAAVLQHRARYFDEAALPREQVERIDRLIAAGTGGTV